MNGVAGSRRISVDLRCRPASIRGPASKGIAIRLPPLGVTPPPANQRAVSVITRWTRQWCPTSPPIEQLNGLLDWSKAAYRQLESFNAADAHELRTPLAVSITRSEVELGAARSAGWLRNTIGGNLEALRQLAGIVNDRLFLWRVDRCARARHTRVGFSVEAVRLREGEQVSLGD